MNRESSGGKSLWYQLIIRPNKDSTRPDVFIDDIAVWSGQTKLILATQSISRSRKPSDSEQKIWVTMTDRSERLSCDAESTGFEPRLRRSLCMYLQCKTFTHNCSAQSIDAIGH